MKRTKDDTAKTRELVMEAATEVFYENGVSRTSLDQIARRAGLTRGAIYWHFKDKAELLTALHSGVMLPQERVIDDMLEREGQDPLTFIMEGGLNFLREFAEDERQQRVYAIVTLGSEFFGEAREPIARITAANEAMYDRLRRLIAMAERRGDLEPRWPVETVTRTMQCNMNGLLTEWLKADRSFDLVEVGRLQIESLFAMVRRKQAGQAPG